MTSEYISQKDAIKETHLTSFVASEQNYRESDEWHLRYAGVIQLHFLVNHLDLIG